MNKLNAVILAGGTGSRLRSVVADRPKVLASVAGKPFIEHLLNQLADQGISKVVLCTGYLGNLVEEYFGDKHREISLVYSKEDRPLGTGGAIFNALPLLSSDTVLVLNGDSYCKTDFRASLDYHRQKQARATLVLVRVKDGSRYGRVDFAVDGLIEKFCEKNGLPTAGWINSGVYWFERSELAKLPPKSPLSMELDVLRAWVGQGIYGYTQTGPFLDIGIPEDYSRAEHFMRLCVK